MSQEQGSEDGRTRSAWSVYDCDGQLVGIVGELFVGEGFFTITSERGVYRAPRTGIDHLSPDGIALCVRLSDLEVERPPRVPRAPRQELSPEAWREAVLVV